MVGVSASVNLPLHHKVQKFSSGTGSPGWSRKKCRKADVMNDCMIYVPVKAQSIVNIRQDGSNRKAKKSAVTNVRNQK